MLALDQDPARPSVAPLIARSAPRRLPTPSARGADVTPLYRFGPDGPALAPGGPIGERQFLVVEAAGAVRLVTLPLPWGTSDVEVLVNLRQSPTGSAVAVAVRDPLFGAGLAYMAQGALDTAAQLFTDAGTALRSEPENPLAATAGSYVLLGTDHRTEETYWDPWLRLLADRHPWLSDGAILRAVRLLRRPGADRDEAKYGLIDAFDRGIPFYTLGLTWLADGLAAFPDDPACASRLDQVRYSPGWPTCANRSSSSTCVKGARDDPPQHAARGGRRLSAPRIRQRRLRPAGPRGRRTAGYLRADQTAPA